VAVNTGLPALRAWRMYYGLSQAELSERSGITEVTIWRLETGMGAPRPSTLAKLAKALRISRERLLHELPPTGAVLAQRGDEDEVG
jgi:transcriptional regulator with XRE-family HTH domain